MSDSPSPVRASAQELEIVAWLKEVEALLAAEPDGCWCRYCTKLHVEANALRKGVTAMTAAEARGRQQAEQARDELAALDKIIGPQGLPELPLVERAVLMRQQNDQIPKIVDDYTAELRTLYEANAALTQALKDTKALLERAKPKHWPGECDHCGIDELPPESCPTLKFIAELDAALTGAQA